MSSNSLIFTPVQAEEHKIPNELQAGWLYFTTDTGKIYLDTDKERVAVGGSGASLYYGQAEITQDEETLYYHLPINKLENKKDHPKIGDIILNKDGAFYRILAINSTDFICSQLAVSGTGGGNGNGPSLNIIRPEITVTNKLNTTSLINGQDFSVYIKVDSYLTATGVPYDDLLTVYWELTDTVSGLTYKRGTFDAQHGVEVELPLGTYLRESTTTKITAWASGGSHDEISRKIGPTVTTSALYLALPSSFSSLKVYDEPNNINFVCNAYGDMDRTVIYYFGNSKDTLKEIGRFDLKDSSSVECTCKLPVNLATHGAHTVKIELWQRYLNGQLGLQAEPIQFEIAIKDGISNTPIIWLGEYENKYYSYDSIVIPYAIYNPAASSTDIILKKDNIKIGVHEDKANTISTFYKWEIAGATLDQMNYYQICCGDEGSDTYVQREISFKVENDPDRIVEPIQGHSLYFNPKGRSNDETSIERQKWSQTIVRDNIKQEVSAIFEGFNWRNNGWLLDESLNTTFLRVSNGAKFTLPLGLMVFAGNTQSQQSHTIEMQLKISNNQLYSNLITNVTRYNVPKYDEDGKISYNDKGEVIYTGNDEIEYSKYLESNYTNYDKFLLDYFNNVVKNGMIYDLLIFKEVQKNIDISKAVCKYLTEDGGSIRGLAIGTQDAFFRNGAETVNVSFVENDLINLTFIYNDALKLLQIFINGVISGVISSTVGKFQIDSNLEFDSTNCDIDIYSIRIYDKELNINNIVHNFAVDRKDIDIFDQVNKYKMAIENDKLKEFQLSYKSIQDYNEKNPNNPTMPYIIFDTTRYNDNKLPWSKKITRNIPIEFVNVPLERAYENGELEELAIKDGLIPEGTTDNTIIQKGIENYYKHHCPSWTSTMSSGDLVEIVVQGTSSEFYPRRNFKVKTKIKDVDIWDESKENEDGTKGAMVKDDVLNLYMHKGPFSEKYNLDKQRLIEDEHYYGYEETRLNDGWYMNNYTNATDRWTFKVDYMESSGSYNAGFASMVSSAYSKHPLQDYLNIINNAEKLGPVVNISKDLLTNGIKWNDYRTSLLGFPVMAFQKKWGLDGKEEYLFIGFYRMLLDKGSDEVLGFKTNKNITHKLLNKKLRDVAECWEFSTNNRGYCSYRDPYGRVKLSFKAPTDLGIKGFVDSTYAPVVTNDFEYRYHAEEDGLDALLNYKNLTSEEISSLNNSYKTNIPVAQNGNVNGPMAAQDLYVDVFSKNWEEVCQWIYSTNLDDVIAEQSYELVEVGEAIYELNKYYIYNNGEYKISSDAFNNELTYYVEDSTLIETVNPDTGEISTELLYPDGYRAIRLVEDINYVYLANKFYQKNNKVYSLITDETFNPNISYYESVTVEDFKDKTDLLVKKASLVAPYTFVEGATYYTYNDQALVSKGNKTGAVIPVTTPVEADFDMYYVEHPVTYLDREYTHDTQEYRTAKFINELKEHFDPEYLATYFIMTEVFECYDSRGKNCMMASWGPQQENGKYIWYPIFYDIDTQLGINNTGIPSFEYNVDATDEGNYSTNDSILWNNFYSFFKNSYILDKYKQLRNSGTIDRKAEKWYDINNPPLTSIDKIEKWYMFDPDTYNSIACRGIRPLIAINLDEYFKYITITNPMAEEQGVAYLEGNEGNPAIDTGTFFYALQGDRSQSRYQFLTNRIEYTDSWLNQMNYARNGANRIRGRISANSMGTDPITSDNWIETDNSPYWIDKEYGTKSHEFDAEYWLKLTPVRSAYVTAGDDSENYESQKYDGITPVNFKLTALESGIRKSENYNEQLLYIYGLKTMRDVGDMSKLYWTEFNIEGEAPKLTRLQLGYDGYDEKDKKYWFNKKINAINLKAKMPLLKEANFSNLTILSNNLTLNLTDSPKLENFRAVGSNLTMIHFADGAALNTVYMPNSLTNLVLNNTNMLTKLITTTNAPIPIKNNEGYLEAEKGLYIDGLFGNDTQLKLANVQMKDIPLGYQSYTFLKQFYQKAASGFGLTLTNVDWCPYTKLVRGDIYDSTANYYLDNGHYGFVEYNHENLSKFNTHILNGEIYRDDHRTDVTTIGKEFLEMLEVFIDTNNTTYKNYDGSTIPELSGIVYIENGTEDKDKVDESYIANTLQKKFPGLIFFFENVKQAYSAKFVLYDEETKTYTYVPNIDGNTSIPSVQKMTQEEFQSLKSQNITPRFDAPFALYKPKKDHYDFYGWSVSPATEEILTTDEMWNSSTSTEIIEGTFDYIYYARFNKHTYNIRFYNNNDPSYGTLTDEDGVKYMLRTVSYGNNLDANVLMPQAIDATELEMRNTFKGWTMNKEAGRVYNSSENISNIIIDITQYPAIKDYKFYAVFQNESVYNSTLDYSYFTFEYNTKGYPIIHVNPERGINLSGKITLPAKDPEGNYIKGIGRILNSDSTGGDSSPDVLFGNNITHVFFEKDSQYEHVENYAFTLGTKSSSITKRSLIGVYLPDTIRTIGNYAFQYQAQMTDINLNDNITHIGISAFDMGQGTGAGNIKISKLPSKLETIGSHAFKSNKNITITSLPDGIVVIPSYCFNNCPNIRIDVFGGENSQLTTIQERAFQGAGQNVGPINRLYFYSKVTKLGQRSFYEYGSDAGPSVLCTENKIDNLDWSITEICGANSEAIIEDEWNGIF